jgi:hypothetical protein
MQMIRDETMIDAEDVPQVNSSFPRQSRGLCEVLLLELIDTITLQSAYI